MPKTGLKTFVYSFSVSLLTIFTVNGVYWYKKNASQTDILIPKQNITLFLNRQSDNPSTRPLPVKKIALTVLPEVKKAAKNSALAPSAEPEIIMADNSDGLEIPLEFGLELTPSAPEIPQTQKIAADFDRLMNNPPPAAAIPLEKSTGKTDIVISDKPKKEPAEKDYQAKVSPSPTVKKPAAATAAVPMPEQPKAYQTAQAEIPAAAAALKSFEAVRPIQDDDGKLPAPKAYPKTKPLITAEADTDSGGAIPLQRVRDVWAGRSENIRIADSGIPNQVALTDQTIPIKSMADGLKPAQPQAELPLPDEDDWEKMADKVPSESAWKVAKSAGKSRNRMLAQQQFSQADNQQVSEALNAPQSEDKGVKVAAETVKNLLIPIPEDILNDENLTPQLVSSKKPDDVRKEIEIEEKLRGSGRSDKETSMQKTEEPSPENEPASNLLTASVSEQSAAQKENEKKKNILNSLSSIFSSSTNVKEKSKKIRDEGVFENLRRKIAGRNRVKIMPTEMRLSFQPNRAEISGQTLRWIQAFAAKAAEDDGTMIEIRIDGTSAMELQQKRLNLLHNILTNKGVEYSKINTVFTQREPNSFIIRTLRFSNINNGSGSGNVNRATQGYYLQW